MNMFRLSFVIITALTIIGCAQKPPAVSNFNYQQQLSAVEQFKDWDMTARVSIQTPEDAVTATLTWRKLGDYQRLELTGSILGTTYTTLELTEDESTLYIKDRPPMSSRNIEALMLQELGFVLPIELLNNWVRALPMDVNDQGIEVDEFGFIRSMSYQNWQVNYRKYKRYPGMSEIELPSRLTMTKSSETIKLAIKTWQTL